MSALQVGETGGSIVSGLQEAIEIGRAHAEWVSLTAAGEISNAICVVEELRLYDRPQHFLNAPLRTMRTWLPGALLKRGRPQEAQAALDMVEDAYGASYESRTTQAQIHYHCAQLGDAARAFSEALVLLKPAAKVSPQYDRAAHAWVDALCLNGEHDRARVMVERLFGKRASWKSDNIRALRQTVRTSDDLDAFGAFLAPSFSKLGAESRMALYHYSMACREQGRYREAEAAIRQRFITSAEVLGFGSKKPPPKGARASWVEDARVTLQNLKAALDEAGAPMFLVSGTLLGCVRENDILGHDKDVDVGVIDEGVDKARIGDVLARSGVFSIKPYQSPGLLRLQHASGVLVDVFWHRQENGRIVHEGLKSKWWNSPFNLVSRDFLGQSHLIPEDYDRYLSENYGDWRRPSVEFETFVDTPNMIITHNGEMMWYYYCKLLEYYMAGKFAQFEKVALAVLAQRPHDLSIIRVLESVRRFEPERRAAS